MHPALELAGADFQASAVLTVEQAAKAGAGEGEVHRGMVSLEGWAGGRELPGGDHVVQVDPEPPPSQPAAIPSPKAIP